MIERDRGIAGFTIIELMVAAVIIGIFASVAVPQFGAWFNEFNLNQGTSALFPRIRALRVEAVARERCTRARFDIENDMVFFEMAKPGVNDGSDCSQDEVGPDEWETLHEHYALASGVELVSVGTVDSSDPDPPYFTFTKHGGSGNINTGESHGAHFTTVHPEPEDECDYKTIDFSEDPGLFLDFKVYDGTYTLTDPPDCAEW